MTPLATLLWAANLICDTTGQLSFKAAATMDSDAQGFAHWAAMLRNRWVWIGIAAFVVEFLLWLGFLSLVPLSLAVLVGSVNILAVSIGGRIFFDEALTPRRMFSTILIALGVALVGWG